MKPFDRQLDADVQEDLDRLDAALRGDDAADSELRALVEDVRAVRPTLGADARERLDERAGAAASTTRPAAEAGPTRAWRPPARRRWRVALVVAAVVVAAIPVSLVVLNEGLVGTSSLSGDVDSGDLIVDDSSSSDLAAVAPDTESQESLAPTEQPRSGDVDTLDSASPDATASVERRSSSGTSSSRRTASGSTLRRDRSVIRDARQTVRVERNGVAAAAGRVSEVVTDQDGYVAASAVSETGGSPRAEFEIVLPSARLDATIAAIGRIGTPVRLERSSVDVTDQRVSLADRLRDGRADRAAVRLQLARAVDPKQRAAKRRELRLMSSRIARLEAEQRELRDQVSTARLSLRLTTARGTSTSDAADGDDGWGLSDAWDDAGHVLQVIGGVLLIAAVILVPLAVLGGLLLVAVRRLRSGRKNRTIDDA